MLRGVGFAPMLSSAASTSARLLFLFDIVLDIVTPVWVYRDDRAVTRIPRDSSAVRGTVSGVSHKRTPELRTLTYYTTGESSGAFQHFRAPARDVSHINRASAHDSVMAT